MRTLTLLFLAALIVAPLHADPYSSLYVIPVVGHTPGANGTNWVSDLAIQNFQSTPISVSMILVQSGEGSFDNTSAAGSSVTVPAGGSVLLHDVLSSFPNTTGALLVGADAPFAVISRAFNTANRVGTGVPPVSDFLESAPGVTNNSTAAAYVPGLIANAGFRSNLGFVAATANGAAPMAVQLTIRGADGSTLGSRTFIVPGGGALEQVQMGTNVLTSSTFDIASAEFRITSGSGSVVPFASIVDNITADSVFVVGMFPPNTLSAKTALPSAFAQAFERLTR